MNSKQHKENERSGLLFDVGPQQALPVVVKGTANPVWTEHKARLIARYLKLFVLVTKSGAYIDAFAGPQSGLDGEENWSARLVLESEPRWLQKFFLIDKNASQVERIRALQNRQPMKRPNEPRRMVRIFHGDCNTQILEILTHGKIRDGEPTFALLDQRTFQCEWKTVVALARHKPAHRPKVELFYFFATSWFARALAATTKNTDRLFRWWGDDSYEALRNMKRGDVVASVVDRFQRELGYRSVIPWPIYEREGAAGRLMYHMIHATDHPAAPELMARAYNNVLKPLNEGFEQLSFKSLGAFLARTAADNLPPPIDQD